MGGIYMLSENSILLRLPQGMDVKQTILFDAIRHSAEVSWLAHSRLDATLTWLVDCDENDLDRRGMINSAYLDAWALVDAIDRFRSLWTILPRPSGTNPPGVPTFSEMSQDVRKLRNITDHVAQMIDYVAAHNSPVMGAISWITYQPEDMSRFYTCVIGMGTAKKSMWEFVNPAGLDPFCGPSGRTAEIHLAAGKHRANLSRLIPEMQRRIKQLEDGLENSVRHHGLDKNQFVGDIFVKIPAVIDTSNGVVVSEFTGPASVTLNT
jgi:hypothetical protein